MRRLGVGLGVDVGVWLDVTEEVGVGDMLIDGVRVGVRDVVEEKEELEPMEGV